MDKLAVKQTKLVNLFSPLLLQDNFSSNTSLRLANFEELRLECLRNLPYSPNLVTTDAHFFCNLDNFLQSKTNNTSEAVSTAFKYVIGSRPGIFFSYETDELT